MFLRHLIIGLLACGFAGSSWAQEKDGPRMRMKGGGPGGRVGMQGIGPGPGPRMGMKKGPPPPSPAMLDRWRGMNADERQQMVDRLPPERRDMFRRRMEMWENMKPAERKGVSDRFDRFRDLPPEQQTTARRAFRQFSQLPPERRHELRLEMNALRKLTEEERAARFNSEEFRALFDARERSLVQDLAASLPE